MTDKQELLKLKGLAQKASLRLLSVSQMEKLITEQQRVINAKTQREKELVKALEEIRDNWKRCRMNECATNYEYCAYESGRIAEAALKATKEE